MKFGEKCRQLRAQSGLTQEEVAQRAGIGRRTYLDYECKGTYPKKREVYAKLAEIFGVDVNYLLTEDDRFVAEAAARYGAQGARQAQKLVDEVTGLFAGGQVARQDKDEMMRAIQDAYWIAKERSSRFAPKKGRGGR